MNLEIHLTLNLKSHLTETLLKGTPTMALYLLLEDFAGDIGGPSNVQIAGAGTILDDAVYNVPALIANGCPLILYNPATMAGPVAAFQKMSGGLAQINPDGNLLALLMAAGAIGGGLVGPATCIYLAPAPLGNDATGQRGNAAKPFATLDAALAVMVSGDTLMLAPGIYGPPSATVPLALLHGTITSWPNGSAQNTAIESVAGPALDLSGGPRDLWRINGIRLSAPTGTDALLADGVAAPQDTYFKNGALVLSEVTITSGGLSCRYAGTVVLGQVTHTSDNEAFKFTSCGGVFNVSARYYGQNLSYQIDDDNDDPLAPTDAGTNQLGLKSFDGACVFPSGTISLERQASITGAPGSFLPKVAAGGGGLTIPVINPAWLSQISLYGRVGSLDLTTIPLPNAAFTVNAEGATFLDAVTMSMVPGGVGSKFNGLGMVGELTGHFGEGVRANLRESSWLGGFLASVTTAGSNGGVVPPTFAMGPLPAAAPTQFLFPMALVGDQYSVAVDLDVLADGPAAVTTRSSVGFDVTPTGVAGNVRAIVSYWGVP